MDGEVTRLAGQGSVGAGKLLLRRHRAAGCFKRLKWKLDILRVNKSDFKV